MKFCMTSKKIEGRIEKIGGKESINDAKTCHHRSQAP